MARANRQGNHQGDPGYLKKLKSRHGNTSNRNLAMNSFVTDTPALVNFMMGKKVMEGS
jgi:hypothetical protein